MEFAHTSPTRSSQNLSAPASTQIERVELTLREMILKGRFRPGDRLAELTLVPLLNASRTPVRLALERLAHQGLLEPIPTGGFRVREFTLKDIWDAIEVRGTLEGAAARLAAERLTDPSELTELRRSVETMSRLQPRNVEDFAVYVRENISFHRELWQLAKSPMLTRALEAACALPFAAPGAIVFGGCAWSDPDNPDRILAVEHHRAIVEAIANRESGRAEHLAREHARMARRNLNRALQSQDWMELIPGAPLISIESSPEVEKH